MVEEVKQRIEEPLFKLSWQKSIDGNSLGDQLLV
jgi:hypothetical protein